MQFEDFIQHVVAETIQSEMGACFYTNELAIQSNMRKAHEIHLMPHSYCQMLGRHLNTHAAGLHIHLLPKHEHGKGCRRGWKRMDIAG